MPLCVIRVYLERIPAVVAERKMIYGEAASLPWVKQPDRMMRSWQKTAYGSTAKRRPASPAILAMMGIGVVVQNGN